MILKILLAFGVCCIGTMATESLDCRKNYNNPKLFAKVSWEKKKSCFAKEYQGKMHIVELYLDTYVSITGMGTRCIVNRYTDRHCYGEPTPEPTDNKFDPPSEYNLGNAPASPGAHPGEEKSSSYNMEPNGDKTYNLGSNPGRMSYNLKTDAGRMSYNLKSNPGRMSYNLRSTRGDNSYNLGNRSPNSQRHTHPTTDTHGHTNDHTHDHTHNNQVSHTHNNVHSHGNQFVGQHSHGPHDHQHMVQQVVIPAPVRYVYVPATPIVRKPPPPPPTTRRPPATRRPYFYDPCRRRGGSGSGSRKRRSASGSGGRRCRYGGSGSS